MVWTLAFGGSNTASNPVTLAALRRVIPITAPTHKTYHIRILAAIEALTL